MSTCQNLIGPTWLIAFQYILLVPSMREDVRLDEHPNTCKNQQNPKPKQ